MADSSMNIFYTVGGYAALIVLSYAVYHVSSQKSKKAVGPVSSKSLKEVQPEPRKEDNKKKQRLANFTSEAQEKAAARANKTEPTPVVSSAPTKTKHNDGSDNHEFAKQLSKAKEGMKLGGNADGGKQREKSVKQSRASETAKPAVKEKTAAPAAVAAAAPSAPSSSAGADADDDQSPALSPEARPVDVSGVSDMLEPTTSTGPSILRLTDTASKKQKQKAAKASEPAETKKQRQNRKKTEAAKAAREEAEKERKVLEEKQRRTARVAEGRPAKDGSQFMAANGANSSWTQGAPNGTNGADTKAAVHEPLDTFEKPSKAAVQKQTSSNSDKNWISSMPSEEEQMEMLKDESDEWSTVKKTKTSKKTTKKTSSDGSGEDVSQPRATTQAKQPVPSISKPAAPQSFGSFSALTKDEPVDDVEEEWEV